MVNHFNETKHGTVWLCFNFILVADAKFEEWTVQNTETIVRKTFSPNTLGCIWKFIVAQFKHNLCALAHGVPMPASSVAGFVGLVKPAAIASGSGCVTHRLGN
jgi:hypothetical protein